jgi:hypothetical protein
MELRTLQQAFDSGVMHRVLAVHVSTHADDIDRGGLPHTNRQPAGRLFILVIDSISPAGHAAAARAHTHPLAREEEGVGNESGGPGGLQPGSPDSL